MSAVSRVLMVCMQDASVVQERPFLLMSSSHVLAHIGQLT